MRDPKRIKTFLKKIEELWLKNPDLRFGQLIIWLAKIKEHNPELFYLEEDELLAKLENELNKE